MDQFELFEYHNPDESVKEAKPPLQVIRSNASMQPCEVPFTAGDERRAEVLGDIGIFNNTMIHLAQDGFWPADHATSRAKSVPVHHVSRRGGRSYPEAGGRDQALKHDDASETTTPILLSPETQALKEKFLLGIRRKGIARSILAGENPSVVLARDVKRHSDDGTNNVPTRSRISSTVSQQTRPHPAITGDHITDAIRP